MVSVPTPPKGVTSTCDHKHMTYSHNTKSKFAARFHHYGRLRHGRPHLYDLKNLRVTKSSKQDKFLKIRIEKL